MTNSPLEFIPTEFRTWMIINPGDNQNTLYQRVETLGEALNVLIAMVKIREELERQEEKYDTYFTQNQIWVSDVSGLEYKDSEGDWVEWHDQDGEDIEFYARENGYEEVQEQFRNKLLKDITER